MLIEEVQPSHYAFDNQFHKLPTSISFPWNQLSEWQATSIKSAKEDDNYAHFHTAVYLSKPPVWPSKQVI